MEEQESDLPLEGITVTAGAVIGVVVACTLVSCVVGMLLSYVGALPWIF